jgi:hypothetical protein
MGGFLIDKNNLYDIIKSMKKIIIILILVVFFSPMITHAAWWKPINWFNGWSFIKNNRTQKQLEKIELKELQEKSESETDPEIETSAQVIIQEKEKNPRNK